MNYKPHFCRRSWWKVAIISCSLFLLPPLFLFFPMGLLKLILAVSFHFLPSEFSFPFLLTYNLSPFLTPPSTPECLKLPWRQLPRMLIKKYGCLGFNPDHLHENFQERGLIIWTIPPGRELWSWVIFLPWRNLGKLAETSPANSFSFSLQSLPFPEDCWIEGGFVEEERVTNLRKMRKQSVTEHKTEGCVRFNPLECGHQRATS